MSLSFQEVQNNGSLFLHLFIVPSGQSPDPKQSSLFSKKMTIKQTHQLNKFKKRRFKKTQNLLTGETAATPEEVKVLQLNLLVCNLGA